MSWLTYEEVMKGVNQKVNQDTFDRAEVEKLFNMFRSKHGEFSSYSLFITGMVVQAFDGIAFFTSRRTFNCGLTRDLASYSYQMFENHMMNVLRDPEKEYKEKKQMADQQKENEERAQKSGSKWAQWLMAFNPSVNLNIVREVSTKIAKFEGFPDIESGGIFISTIMQAYSDYADEHEDDLTAQINKLTAKNNKLLAKNAVTRTDVLDN